MGLMFGLSTSYLNVSWWMVDPCMAKLGEQGSIGIGVLTVMFEMSTSYLKCALGALGRLGALDGGSEPLNISIVGLRALRGPPGP